MSGSLPRFAQYGIVGPASAVPESTGACASASASEAPASFAPASGAPPSAGMHSTSGGAQGKPHMPILQPSPSGQTLPHEPQFFGSLPVSMQPPSHAFMPVAQPAPPSVDGDPSCPAPPSPVVPSPVGPSPMLASCSGATLVFAPLAHAAIKAPLRPRALSAAQSSRHRRMRTSRTAHGHQEATTSAAARLSFGSARSQRKDPTRRRSREWFRGTAAVWSRSRPGRTGRSS